MRCPHTLLTTVGEDGRMSKPRSAATLVSSLVLLSCVALGGCSSGHAGADSTPATFAGPTITDVGATTAVAGVATTVEPPTAAPSTTIAATTTPTATAAATSLVTSPDGPPTSDPQAVALAPAVSPIGTVLHGTLSFGGRDRTYRIYVPSALPPGPVPLFIGLHGGTGWADQFAQTDHIEGLAESNGFIVVHPDGIRIAGGPGEVWNGGSCCGVAARIGVHDVGFIRALIDSIEAHYPIDAHRVYAFGHSNGAIMSYRLACELSDRIVGVGMWAGTLGIDACEPSQPVSIIHAHGAADQNIPLAGGTGSESISGVAFAPPHEGFDVLAAADGCPPAVSSSAGDVTTERRGPCASGTAAVFVTIATANHSWPDGTPIVTPKNGAGYSGYDATAEIVGFLLAHPRP